MDSVKLREKKFHNKIFKEDKRKKVNAFYQVQRKSHDFYRQMFGENCNELKILEYGCGTGSEAYSLAERGAQVSAIDISEEGVRQAQVKAEERNLQIDFQVADAEQTPFESGTFDRIFGSGIIHHLDLDRSFSELARILKPDGKCVFIEPMGHNFLLNLYRKITPSLRTPDEHPICSRDFEIARKYFASVETHYFNLVTPLGIPFLKFRISDFVLRQLEKLEALTLKCLPFMGRYGWTVVMVLSQPRK